MFLSKLVLNPLSRAVRGDLANFYELHRTILQAFPDEESTKTTVLYRVDTDRRTGITTGLVQSGFAPDWGFLNERGPYLLGPPEFKDVNLSFKKGQALKFRLRANPTKRVAKRDGGTKAGYIKALFAPDEQAAWLERKGKTGGFDVKGLTIIPEGNVVGRKDGHKITIYSVLYNGILEVTDPGEFISTVEKGIGRAKRFGFGLLSLAPFQAS